MNVYENDKPQIESLRTRRKKKEKRMRVIATPIAVIMLVATLAITLGRGFIR